jgi:hypothetical protein
MCCDVEGLSDISRVRLQSAKWGNAGVALLSRTTGGFARMMRKLEADEFIE